MARTRPCSAIRSSTSRTSGSSFPRRETGTKFGLGRSTRVVVFGVERRHPDHLAVSAGRRRHVCDRGGIDAHRTVQRHAAEDANPRNRAFHDEGQAGGRRVVVLEQNCLHARVARDAGDLQRVDRARAAVGGAVDVQVDDAVQADRRAGAAGAAPRAGRLGVQSGGPGNEREQKPARCPASRRLGHGFAAAERHAAPSINDLDDQVSDLFPVFEQ